MASANLSASIPAALAVAVAQPSVVGQYSIACAEPDVRKPRTAPDTTIPSCMLSKKRRSSATTNNIRCLACGLTAGISIRFILDGARTAIEGVSANDRMVVRRAKQASYQLYVSKNRETRMTALSGQVQTAGYVTRVVQLLIRLRTASAHLSRPTAPDHLAEARPTQTGTGRAAAARRSVRGHGRRVHPAADHARARAPPARPRPGPRRHRPLPPGPGAHPTSPTGPETTMSWSISTSRPAWRRCAPSSRRNGCGGSGSRG